VPYGAFPYQGNFQPTDIRAGAILDSYDATKALKAAQFCFLNILPLDEYLAIGP
jgi:hypothetical protein